METHSKSCSTWQQPSHCTQCPSPLPKTFSKDLWVCPEHEVWSCSCPTHVSPEVPVRLLLMGKCHSPHRVVGFIFSYPSINNHSSTGRIDRADALKINAHNSPGYSSLGWSKLHPPLLRLNFIPLEAAGDFHLLHASDYTYVTPVRIHRRQALATVGSIADKPHPMDFFPWLNGLLPQTFYCVFVQRCCLLNCFR